LENKRGRIRRVQCGETIADNLSKAGWSWGCVSAIDREGRSIWIADAHRDDGKRFIVRADEKADRVFGTGFSNPGCGTGNRYAPRGCELMRGRARLAGRFLQKIERFRVTSRRISCSTSVKGKTD
jgi:hypothetical protein